MNTMTRYYGTAVPTQPGAPREGRPDLRPARISLKDAEWCDEAGCPATKCVHCKETSRMTTTTDIYETADLWPIYENANSTHRIGYIVSSDEIPGLPCPRLGEVYQRPNGRWAAWPMGSVFGDDENPPQSYLGFTTRRYAVEYLIAYAQDRARWGRTA